MDRRSLVSLGGVLVALLGLWLMTAPTGPERLPAAPLVLSSLGGETVTWSSCPTPKCLTVYVAPWCGVCRASTAFLKAFVDFIGARGVTARIVVGRASAAEVAEYARDFGPKALLDPEGKVPLVGGVPQFIVTDAAGAVLKRQPGVPRIVRPPIPRDELERLAAYFSLP